MKALAKSVAAVGQVVSVAIGSNFTTGETKPEGICFVLVQDGLITGAFRKLTF